MVYQALYRKYRPKKFDEVCGQKIVVQTLKNSITNNKLSHAYLFIGPRGTGKTSIAKIFAKTINCENPVDGISCEKCEICNLSNNNENVDIIEMDAASNNGVDEIREIRNHVSLMPTFSKYKIYIIDEVHMLSSGAFNALLKTLEEPPKHVIFILATTEPQKVPLTIISRCQSFEFKPIPIKFMFEKIKNICDSEKIDITDDSINQICENSNGGLRDAISLLDQLNAYCTETIKKEDVLLLSGRISTEEIYNLFDLLSKGDIESTFKLSDNFNEEGKDLVLLCEDIIKYLKDEIVIDQINSNSKILKIIDKKILIDIIFEITNYINVMKNLKDKKIYFDLLLINIFNKINSTNVRINNIGTEVKNNENNIEKVVNSAEDNKKEETEDKKEEIIETESNNSLDERFKYYDELMNIRLNNIIAEADKESLKDYLNFFEKLEENLDNLDERKIYNLLLDCTIKAGSKDGIIITTSNKNILEELYENIKEIQSLFVNKLSKDLKLCFYIDSLWNEKRKVFISKIKNKEKIEILDENEILNKINNEKSSENNEFDDLLEIGE